MRYQLFGDFDEKQRLFIVSNSICQEDLEEHPILDDSTYKLNLLYSKPEGICHSFLLGVYVCLHLQTFFLA